MQSSAHSDLITHCALTIQIDTIQIYQIPRTASLRILQHAQRCVQEKISRLFVALAFCGDYLGHLMGSLSF